jgi:hypothetical protein
MMKVLVLGANGKTGTLLANRGDSQGAALVGRAFVARASRS